MNRELSVEKVTATPTTHPPGFYFIFFGEFAERCSYYGMRTILFLYMTQALQIADTEANRLYATFKMACYFLPLVGGLIADRWLGKYWTIVGFSVPYVAGHFILGFPSYAALLVALALLAGGSGVIKPNISTLMGQTYDQRRPGQQRLRAAAFMWFYFSVNIGALLSMFSLPLVRQYYILANLSPEIRAQAEAAALAGKDIAEFASPELLQSAYAFAFAVPAWLMVLSLAIFAAGKPFYAEERPGRREMSPEERRLQWQTLKQLFGIFGLMVLFWFGYEHNDTIWIAFIRDYVDLKIPFRDQPISPDQLQFLNALVVILSIPTFNFLFGWLDPQVKFFTPTRKIVAGFLFTAASIAIMALAGLLVQGQTEQIVQGDKVTEVATAKVSFWWPTVAYVVLTIGEVLLYGTMLELAYTAAPRSMKGFITACFLVTNTLGNFLNVLWMPLYGGSLKDEMIQRGPLLPSQFFGLTALCVFAAGVVFLFIGKKFERSQAEAAAAGVT